MPDPVGICYLCGEQLREPIDRDHVPPRQLYAYDIRKLHAPNLLTIPVHRACNRAFQHDEDYFVHTLMPFARGSYTGNAVVFGSASEIQAREAAAVSPEDFA